MIKTGVLLAIFSLSATTALASETDTTQSQAAQTDSQQTFTPHWTGYVEATYADDWASDYRDDRNVEFDMQLGYQFTSHVSAGIITGTYYLDNSTCSAHSKDYWCIAPTYLYTNYSNLYSFGHDDLVTIGAKGRILLPTTQYAQDTHLYFGAFAYLPISFDVNRYVKGLSLVLQPNVKKYFNKYKTAGGQNLTDYSLGFDLSSTYQITDKIVFSVSMTDSHYVTYAGNSTYPTLSHTEEIGYELTDSWYMGVGYSNNAQYYNPEHGSNPISSLFDDKDPHFYLTTYYAF
ncbi:hypothetical protein A9264_06810 [Vibrio sp. UCD-FRSSP16_10]|nr:hypothetical protein A9264_06810 [Vibrio sp. UCD-FRSSP16_10]OBT17882.1 hypothetical protein A9260_00800 [Vibrio sp. UCD-FRSSP16_30]